MRIKGLSRCSASFMALVMVASPAFAQDVPAGGQDAQETPAESPDATAEAQAGQPDGEAIVVTGIRESLRSSQNIRRNSDQIVDAIVAEDIGKLPDLAVSDTAARIPGVQVVRQGGEAARVLIRGLPDFATTYNGREIFTAETRVVALQDFPSSNIAALEVFKTSTANLVEPGLAGLVNVRSRRPFDFSEGQVSASVWGLYTVQAESITPNFNALITERWDTEAGDFGMLLNISYTELDYLDSEPSNTDFIADPTINGQRVRFPDVQRLFYRSGNRVRPSANFAMQWRPNDNFEMYVDALYQGFRNKIDDRLVAAPLYGGANYSNLAFRPGTNQLSSGTVTGLGDPIFTFQGGTYNQTDTYQIAIGGIYEAGPLRLSADLATTSTTFSGSTESLDRIFAGQAGTSVDFNLEVPQFTIRGFDVNNVDNHLFDGLYEESQESSGDDIQARFDGTYTFSDIAFLRSLEFGARYTDRSAHREFGNRFAGFRGRNIPASRLPVLFELTKPGFGGTDVQSGFRSFLSPTYGSIRQGRTALRQFVLNNAPFGGFGSFTTADPTPNPESVYDASEQTLAGYAQLNVGFGETVEGIIGLRAVRTESEVAGTSLVEPVGGGARVPTPVVAGQTYTDYLPNASIRWRVTPQLQLRAAYSQTRTRPNFGQLNPSASVGAPDPSQGGLRTGTGGNPNLQPVESENYDASIEYFFSRTGFASLSLFRRDLTGFIQDQTLPQFQDPVLGLVRLTAPVNTRSGRIDGFEAQLSTFFDFEFVPSFLRNFGVQANYTYLDGEVEILNPVTNTYELDRITSPEGPGDYGGVSKHSVNVAGLYEAGPFSARLTYNWRSRYLDRRDVRGNEEGGFYREEARPAGRVDFSANYSFRENLTVFFDATNLTRDPFRVDFSSARDGAPRADYVRYLRYDESTFSLGLRFRL